MTSYCDVYSPSIAEYENEDIPKIYLAAEESPCDPSTSEYSERVTQMLDHLCQISIPTNSGKGPVYVSTVVLCSLAYNAADVIDNDNLVTALSAQIQISIVLIGMIMKPSVEPIV